MEDVDTAALIKSGYVKQHECFLIHSEVKNREEKEVSGEGRTYVFLLLFFYDKTRNSKQYPGVQQLTISSFNSNLSPQEEGLVLSLSTFKYFCPCLHIHKRKTIDIDLFSELLPQTAIINCRLATVTRP